MSLPAAVLALAVLVPYARAAAPTGAAKPADSRPPIERIIHAPEFNHLTISPSGKLFAVTVPLPDHVDRNALVIYDLKQRKILHVLKMADQQVFSDFRWIDDDKLIATPAVKLGGIDTPRATGELYLVDAANGSSRILFGYRAPGTTGSRIHKGHSEWASARLLDVLPDDPHHVLIETVPWTSNPWPKARVLNVDTGNSEVVANAPAMYAQFVADHEGTVRAAYAQASDLSVRLWTRVGVNAPWALLNDPAKSGLDIEPLGFAADNRHLYVEVSGDNGGPATIASMDTQTGSRQVLYTPKAADPLKLLSTADGRDAYGVIAADGKLSTVVFDTDRSRPEARATLAFKTSFPGQLAYLSSFSRDGRYAIVTVQSDRNPGDYYLFDLKKWHADYLVSRMRWIDPKSMRPTQPIELRARDGLALHGYLTTPAGDRPYPLVVLPHGGPYGIRDYWSFDPEIQLLASRGYAVLQVNYRGSGGYGAAFQQKGYMQWGRAMQDDLTDATRWAIAQGFATPGRICLYGGSYGGYAALEGVVREPDLYRCTVGYAGVYDLPLMYKRGDIPQSLFGEKYLKRVIGTDPDDLYRRSPISGADRIKASILLVHGGQDQRVPIAHANAMRAALDKAGKPYEWLEEPGEGHGFYRQAHRIEFYTRLLDFLNRNIGASANTQSTGAGAASTAAD